jgi:hypothetical protein
MIVWISQMKSFTIKCATFGDTDWGDTDPPPDLWERPLRI